MQTLALVREEQPVEVSVTDVLEEVLQYAEKIAYKQITIERRYQNEKVQGNPGAIRQVLQTSC